MSNKPNDEKDRPSGGTGGARIFGSGFGSKPESKSEDAEKKDKDKDKEKEERSGSLFPPKPSGPVSNIFGSRTESKSDNKPQQGGSGSTGTFPKPNAPSQTTGSFPKPSQSGTSGGGSSTGSFPKPTSTSTFPKPTQGGSSSGSGSSGGSSGSAPFGSSTRSTGIVSGGRTEEKKVDSTRAESSSKLSPSRPDERTKSAPKPDDKKPEPSGQKPGGIFGRSSDKPDDKPTEKKQDDKKPEPSGQKPGGLFGRGGGDKPADKPAEKKQDDKKPEPSGQKPGGLFGLFGRGGGDKPADKPAEKKPEPSAGNKLGVTSPPLAKPDDKKPDEKKPETKTDAAPRLTGLGGLLNRGKQPEKDKPAPPVQSPKLATSAAPKTDDKKAEAPKPGLGNVFGRLAGDKPADKPADAAAKPGALQTPKAPAVPAKKDDKPASPTAGGRGSFLGGLFAPKPAPKPEAKPSIGAVKAPTAGDAKRASSIPGAPPALGEKRAKPLDGTTQVKLRNQGLTLDQKLDVIGWSLIAAGLVIFAGLVQPDPGTFTKAVVDILGALFGYGRYVWFVPCFAYGGWLLIRHFKTNPLLVFDANRIIGIVLLYLTIVTTLHAAELFNKVVWTWDELEAVSTQAVEAMRGGGWVGDRLYMIAIRLAGEWGVPVILSVFWVVSVMLTFEITLAEISVYLKSIYQFTARRIGAVRSGIRWWTQALAARRALARKNREAKRALAQPTGQTGIQPTATGAMPAAAALAGSGSTANFTAAPASSAPQTADAPTPAKGKAGRTAAVMPALTPAVKPSATPEEAPPASRSVPLTAPSLASTAPQTPQEPAAAAGAAPAAAQTSPQPAKTRTGPFAAVFGRSKAEPAPTRAPEESAPIKAADGAASTQPTTPEKTQTGALGGLFGRTKAASTPAAAKPSEPDSTQPTTAAATMPTAAARTGSAASPASSAPTQPTSVPSDSSDDEPVVAAVSISPKPATPVSTGVMRPSTPARRIESPGEEPAEKSEPPKPQIAKPAALGGSIFGAHAERPDKPPSDMPEESDEEVSNLEKTQPAISTGVMKAVPSATQPAETSTAARTQPSSATGIFKPATDAPASSPAPKGGSSIFGSFGQKSTPKPPEPAAPSSADADDAPPKPEARPTSSIFGSARPPASTSSSSIFKPAPKPGSDKPPAAPEAKPDDALVYVPDEDAALDDAPATPISALRLSPVPSKAAPEAEAEDADNGDAVPLKVEHTVVPVTRAVTPLAGDLPPLELSNGVNGWQMPDYRELLSAGSAQTITDEMIEERARKIEETLEAFGAPGKVVEKNVGPTITQFGVEPGYLQLKGGKTNRVKVGAIAKLDADLALALAARSIRIEAPVPGKGYVGIEVPNPETALVGLRDIMGDGSFHKLKSRLRLALGKSIDGASVVADLTQMPHLLIAGTTGSGKSVCVNAIIACLLLQNSPEDMKMIMVDPKRVELTGYNGIPHLVAPVVVDLERIVGVLKWVTREMDDRYKKFSAIGARNILDYNGKIKPNETRLPYLVVVIDELADLMMLAPDETEKVLTRLAQMARATGIHLIISTQRPSVDVVTGLIKANFPARISFAVASSVDSRVILDAPGAEKLLGKGDMLFQAPDAPAPIRVQGVYVSDAELNRITTFWKTAYRERPDKVTEPVSFDSAPDKPTAKLGGGNGGDPFQSRAQRFGSSVFGSAPTSGSGASSSIFRTASDSARDADKGEEDIQVDEKLYEQAVAFYRQTGNISVTTMQTKLDIKYHVGEKIIKLMRQRGVLKDSE